VQRVLQSQSEEARLRAELGGMREKARQEQEVHRHTLAQLREQHNVRALPRRSSPRAGPTGRPHAGSAGTASATPDGARAGGDRSAPVPCRRWRLASGVKKDGRGPANMRCAGTATALAKRTAS
jgi:hypothetical protein